jgi:hypothetical protein
MTTTVELPRASWVKELNAFTLKHEGALVSMEVYGVELGDQPGVASLPLIGISADRIDHDGTVTVSVARSATEHFTHVIRDVRRIFVDQPHDRPADVVMFIESMDDTRTVLQLRPAPQLDGAPRRAG